MKLSPSTSQAGAVRWMRTPLTELVPMLPGSITCPPATAGAGGIGAGEWSWSKSMLNTPGSARISWMPAGMLALPAHEAARSGWPASSCSIVPIGRSG